MALSRVGMARRRLCGAVLLLTSAACAHSPKTAAVAPPAPPPETARQAPDATPRLIAEADGHLQQGLTDLAEGHLNAAREAFDQAIDTYLSAPGGATANPRIAEAYRRTLDTIHAREVEALAQGDGFTENQTEPAPLDTVVAEVPAEEPASEETRALATLAVEAEANDLPIELNDAVLTCVNLYQGRLKDWFEGALSRGGKYLPHMREVFASEGVPQDLAYLAMVESAFRPAAYSRAKAKGVWQFIADTGKRYGLEQDWWVDERSDTEKATRAAARYLKELYAMFGDWNLAMAGYNAGEGVIQRGIDRYKTRDYWELRQTKALRRETRNYVPLILAAIVVAGAPEKYGIEVRAEEPMPFERVPVKGAIDLRVIAECTATPLENLQQLNPELRRLATPAGRTFDVRVPEGTGLRLSECLANLPADKRVAFRTHVVGRGQTLATIARANGVRASDVASANNLRVDRRLAVGTELIIPIDPRR
ncbi:MAG TPA: transglycosylase SLT domain-containing protein, partial [Vicinamibacteria bacterium]|nr:transglycosylase SLT domain-containing protein [Vicinamibacteria bacterium]